MDTRRLRKAVITLLCDLLRQEDFELGIQLVGATEMARLNETYLRHQGLTDVITFDYAEPAAARARKRPDESRLTGGSIRSLHGEIIICVDEALAQSRRWRTTCQDEMTRYAIHGILHLLGFDDQRPTQRRRMKREENRLLAKLRRLGTLSRPRRSKPKR